MDDTRGASLHRAALLRSAYPYRLSPGAAGIFGMIEFQSCV